MLQNHVPVTLEVNIETKFTGDHEHGFDTVAEIPGTDPKLKDQVVMVGGHLDSWISGTGATDNGAGSDRGDGGGAHPEGARRQAAADHPHRAVVAAKSRASSARRDTSSSTSAPSPTPNRRSRGHCPRFLRQPRRRSRPPRSGRRWTPTTTSTTARARCAACTRRRTTPSRRSSRSGSRRWRTSASRPSATATPAAPTTCRFDAVGLPGFQFIQDPMDYETRTHHSDMDTVDRLHRARPGAGRRGRGDLPLQHREREAMMPRKPFPHPELERRKTAPLKGIYPGATGEGEDAPAGGRPPR